MVSNMLKDRIITAIFIVLYIVLMIYFGGWFYNLSVLFFAFIGMHEIYNALHRCGYHPVTPIGYIFVLIFYFFFKKWKSYWWNFDYNIGNYNQSFNASI